MSVYGYHRETTPFIRKWANAASLFRRPKQEVVIPLQLFQASCPAREPGLTGNIIMMYLPKPLKMGN